MRTLITGIARSGTSALYFKLRDALPETTWCLFEPRHIDAAHLYRHPDVLAKVIIGPPADFDYEPYRGFDPKIMIVRDPRDNLVSRLSMIRAGRRRLAKMRRRLQPSSMR